VPPAWCFRTSPEPCRPRALLERERLRGIPAYREYNRTYYALAPTALAEVLVSELERVQAVKRSGGFLIPTIATSDSLGQASTSRFSNQSSGF
jgi:hypothetical protein